MKKSCKKIKATLEKKQAINHQNQVKSEIEIENKFLIYNSIT